jgi:hypothetical protein
MTCSSFDDMKPFIHCRSHDGTRLIHVLWAKILKVAFEFVGVLFFLDLFRKVFLKIFSKVPIKMVCRICQ